MLDRIKTYLSDYRARILARPVADDAVSEIYDTAQLSLIKDLEELIGLIEKDEDDA